MRSFSPRLVVACLSVFALVACRRGGEEVAPTPAGVPTVSDGNIMAIILAANNTDLAYARMVPSRSTNAEVAAFARRMTTDHSILNARVNEIGSLNRIEAEDNEVSLDFRDNSATRRDAMRDLMGARFDSAYIANEVTYHTELLGAIEKVLAPQARNAELREFVNNLKPAVSAHLAHAEQLRAALAKRK
jgi:putative membrane protein